MIVKIAEIIAPIAAIISVIISARIYFKLMELRHRLLLYKHEKR